MNTLLEKIYMSCKKITRRVIFFNLIICRVRKLYVV